MLLKSSQEKESDFVLTHSEYEISHSCTWKFYVKTVVFTDLFTEVA